ncbi:MAG: D-alanyl-D-alanine carboxypeptidase/D-alanyl-D-alanine-endopeptidase [Bdellovibrionales bacterium]|nr:D-alanyl-D-alanine carboxypeptidase/D-alanyl-D-alanine-endopeptidase [Bdellovibrionales bacterium]
MNTRARPYHCDSPTLLRGCILLWLLLWVSLALLNSAIEDAWADADPLLPGKLAQYVASLDGTLGKEAVLSVYVAEAESGKEVFAHAGRQPVVPASTLKIVTTVAALRLLGAEYRFPTEVFADHLPSETDQRLDASVGLTAEPDGPKRVGKGIAAGNLYIRGYGDPSLVNERLLGLAEKLQNRGIAAVEHIVVDNGLFVNPPAATGPRPYQAALSAVALNYNCYQISIAPLGSGLSAVTELTAGVPYTLHNLVKSRKGVKQNVSVIQIPTSEGFNPAVRGRAFQALYELPDDPVRVTVKGSIGTGAPPIEYYHTVRNPVEYFGTVFRHYLEVSGIEVRGRVLQGETPAGSKLVALDESEPLSEILVDLNHYSSNFLAGQILYALGQDKLGYFRQDLGLERLAQVLLDLGYQPTDFQFYDASGLDSRNRTTTEQLVKVLVDGYRDFSIAPDLIASLSRFGRTGTLEKRKLLSPRPARAASGQLYREERRRADSVWAKTGTIDSVSSLAGFLESRTGDRLAFAIIINGGVPKEKSKEVEEQLVRLLIDVAA